LGVEPRAQALAHDRRLEQQGQVRRQPRVVAADDRQRLAQQRPDRDLARRPVIAARHQVLQVLPRPSAVDALAGDADL
jgi:hypothetical protein